MAFHGNVVFVLHTHIPYVLGHNLLEEEMILEAAVETYIPLLDTLNQLVSEGRSPKITIGISPVLAEQLSHPKFKRKLVDYCRVKADLAQKDAIEFDANPHMNWLALNWKQVYKRKENDFVKKYDRDLVGAFRKLQDDGHIELITCGATHPYMPALLEDQCISAQLKLAIENYRKHFGRSPNGIWVPECGYRPAGNWKPKFSSRSSDPPRYREGIDTFLSENDLQFFIVDQHQLEKATPRDLEKTPLDTYFVGGSTVPKNPVTIFVRDDSLSEQVWTRHRGYPGNGAYLDFHKQHAEGKHKYWKVTDRNVPMGYKELYYPDDAELKLVEHAGHYKWLIAQSLKPNFEKRGEAKSIVTAFDTELFGHWWFEGMRWLYHVLKYICDDPEIRTLTCSEQMAIDPAYNYVNLPESSWGANFDSSTWINPEVEWIWERVYHAEHEVRELAKAFVDRKDDEILGRILRQTIRELLILEASDWQFMVTNWSMRDHAEKRVIERHEDFKRLAKLAWNYGHGREVDQGEWDFLHHCEQVDNIFENVDLSWYA